MWLIVHYQPCAFFSLRPANATTSGGKTLIVPTPFAIKMALLDAAIRVHGVKAGEDWFKELRDLQVAARLPLHLAVVSLFTKIRRPLEVKDKKKEAEKVAQKKANKDWPWDSSISFREFVQYAGEIQLAFSISETVPLAELAAQISYLGKRGGFMQFVKAEESETFPVGFTLLNPEADAPFLADGVLQMLDDCGSKLTFAHANIYSDKGIKRDDQTLRRVIPVVLPYRQIQFSRSFGLYERIGK